MERTPVDSQPQKEQESGSSEPADANPTSNQIPHRFSQSSAEAQQVDPHLVKETKKQISALIQEITELAQTQIAIEDFYDGFLTRTTSALASVGGAIWTVEEQGRLKLAYQINLSASGLSEDADSQVKHARLLERLARTGEPTIVAPQSAGEEPDQPGNPTDFLLVICPLKVDQEVVGLVEVFQRPGTGPTTQRGYLRFLAQMCDIASDFLKNRQIRDFQNQQSLWGQLEGFIRASHRGLNPRQTAFTIANEGQKLIGCDRVTLALFKHGKCEIKAVSGLDSIERRANQVKRLNKLVSAAMKTSEALWYFGDDDDLPPQIESKLHEYLDSSHSKVIGIEPLFETQIGQQESEQTQSTSDQKLIGALVAEQLKDSHVTEGMVEKTKTVAQHGADALTNSMAHDSIFLMPLWQRLSKMTWLTQARQLPKTLIIAGIIAAAMLALFLIPYPFTLGANGKLAPRDRAEIFAQVDGVLQEIDVPQSPDEMVDVNHMVARMTNNELTVQIRQLQGQIQQTTEEIAKLRNAQHNTRRQRDDDWQIDGELNEAIVKKQNLESQLKTKSEQLRKLYIYSPMPGYVIDWQIRQKLLRRPINRGQHLMTIVAPDTRWVVEFELPEKRVGHLLRAQSDSDEPLEVTFSLASQPGHQYTGHVIEIERRMDVRSEQGNSSLVKVAFESEEISKDLLRAGTRIRGKFHCGHKSIGQVWLHDLIETVQSSVLFWF